MADNGMRGRVKGLLAGAPPVPEPAQRMDTPRDPDSVPHAQRDALLVLTLAQRTADEHVASAHHQADKIHADAQARAAKITADAETRIAALREHADKEASEFQDAAHTAVRAV